MGEGLFVLSSIVRFGFQKKRKRREKRLKRMKEKKSLKRNKIEFKSVDC